MNGWSAPSLLPLFVVGLAGSVHCAGMCGGVVGALSAAPAARRIAIRTAAPTPAPSSTMARLLAYNGGRLASYMLAGALAGGVAGSARDMARLAHAQLTLYWLANAMLVALGLYLAGAWNGVARLEAGGQWLWRRLQPLGKTLVPVDTPLKALALGGLWGWLPCGMVYSALLTALLSGSALNGAAAMLAFGLGTLPMLLALGALGARARALLRRRGARIACGLLVLGFGLLGMARALHGTGPGWLDALCVTGHP